MKVDLEHEVKILSTGLEGVHLKWRVILLTPEFAAKLLAQNHPNNRRLKGNKIDQLENDLNAGNGKLSYDPIVMDMDGFMVNGQNRCTAVVNCGVPLPVLLISGFPRESLLASDQGTPRNVADVARISGKQLPHGEQQYSSVARLMMHGLRAGHATSIQSTLAFIDRHKVAIEFAFECLPKNIRFITQSPVRAVVARAYYQKEYRERVKEFCIALVSGLVENRKTDSAVILLRNWLLDYFSQGVRSAGGRGRPRPTQVYAKTERALKAFLTEEAITKIQETSKELFPIP